MHTRRLLPIFLFSFLLMTACRGRQRVHTDTTIGKEVMQVVMPTGKGVVHPQHGKEEWFAIGPMKGEGDTKANGVAQAHVFADGATIVTVNLNIHEPKAGYFVAWVQKPGSTERVLIDRMQNPLKDVRFAATADIAKDLRDYTTVIVTLQRSSSPQKDDPVVATGVLKHQER